MIEQTDNPLVAFKNKLHTKILLLTVDIEYATGSKKKWLTAKYEALSEVWNEIKAELHPPKIIYCNECEIEEVVDQDKPNSCPFCESKNVRVEGRESIPKEDTKDGI